MLKIIHVVALCALMAVSTDARRGRGLRQAGGRRNLEVTSADTSKAFEQMYFAETMTEDSTVILLESGPFKLEASCKTVVVQNTYSSWYYSSTYYDIPSSNSSTSSMDFPLSSYTKYTNSSGSYSYDDYFTDDWTWDPNGNYTDSYLALDLTYTAPEADYLYGSASWWYNHPNETVMTGAWEANEVRTSTVFRGYDGSWGDDFTLQSLSGHYIGVDGGDTIGIHREHSGYVSLHRYRDGHNSPFPEGIDCMVAGFLTYHIPAVEDAV